MIFVNWSSWLRTDATVVYTHHPYRSPLPEFTFAFIHTALIIAKYINDDKPTCKLGNVQRFTQIKRLYGSYKEGHVFLRLISSFRGSRIPLETIYCISDRRCDYFTIRCHILWVQIDTTFSTSASVISFERRLESFPRVVSICSKVCRQPNTLRLSNPCFLQLGWDVFLIAFEAASISTYTPSWRQYSFCIVDSTTFIFSIDMFTATNTFIELVPISKTCKSRLSHYTSPLSLFVFTFLTSIYIAP